MSEPLLIARTPDTELFSLSIPFSLPLFSVETTFCFSVSLIVTPWDFRYKKLNYQNWFPEFVDFDEKGISTMQNTIYIFSITT